jgi:hypothetical protein
MRCYTRADYDLADRFPAVTDAAGRRKASSFLIDGEAVIRRERWNHVTRSDHTDATGCSIFFRISSQTDLTSAVITDACSMRSKISFASSRYFCAVSST